MDGSDTLATAMIIFVHSMGWHFGHGFSIHVNEKDYMVAEHFQDAQEYDSSVCDGTLVKISEAFTKDTVAFLTYDFGDGWEHDISVVEIVENSTMRTPYCLRAHGNCPPENCGGIDGFVDLLHSLENPEAPDAEELIEWLGGTFDTNAFDIQKINKTFSSALRIFRMTRSKAM